MLKIRTCKDAVTLERVKDLLKLDGIKFEADPTHKDEIFVDASEPKIRLRIQEYFDNNRYPLNKLLVDGNGVYSFTKIANEARKLKKANSTEKMSKGFYDFMYLNFTIAHYNIHGWIDQYPTWDDVMQIGLSTPHWKTDVQRILDEVFFEEEMVRGY
jgi:hypothetical protein